MPSPETITIVGVVVLVATTTVVIDVVGVAVVVVAASAADSTVPPRTCYISYIGLEWKRTCLQLVTSFTTRTYLLKTDPTEKAVPKTFTDAVHVRPSLSENTTAVVNNVSPR